LGLTNALVEVVEDIPGQKKVLEAHEQMLKIANYNQLNGIIHGVFTLDNSPSTIFSPLWQRATYKISANL